MKRLSRKQRRMIESGDLEQSEVLKEQVFKIKAVRPITENQKQVFESFYSERNLLLTGSAGTGKTFIACYLGLNEVFDSPEIYHSLTIIRSVVPTRDMGFIPGKIHEKQQVYELPYVSIFQEMSHQDEKKSYDKLKSDGLVNFITTSFIRGHTLKNTIVVVDEIQNMTAEEIHTVFTRLGKNTRVIFCGDIRQTDLKMLRQTSGFKDFVKVIDKMKSFDHIAFTRNDIVRSDLVKEYIIAREKLEDSNEIANI
jgi:predicted ribonuclease YlaK